MREITRGVVLVVAVLMLASSAAKHWEPFTPGKRTSNADDDALTTAAGQVMTDYGLTVQSAVDGLVTTEWAILSESVEAAMGNPNVAPQARWVTTIHDGMISVAIQCRHQSGERCDGRLPNGAKWSAQANEMAEAIVRAAGRPVPRPSDLTEAVETPTESPGSSPVAGGFFCTASPIDSLVGVCNTSREACAVSQRRLVDSGQDVGPCVGAAHAVCFAAVRADGTELSGCMPTVGGCRRARENATLSLEHASVGDCGDR